MKRVLGLKVTGRNVSRKTTKAITLLKSAGCSTKEACNILAGKTPIIAEKSAEHKIFLLGEWLERFGYTIQIDEGEVFESEEEKEAWVARKEGLESPPSSTSGSSTSNEVTSPTEET